MTDIARITAQLTLLIAAGVAGRELIAPLAHPYPDPDRREFVAALQAATAAAEPRALWPHSRCS